MEPALSGLLRHTGREPYAGHLARGLENGRRRTEGHWEGNDSRVGRHKVKGPPVEAFRLSARPGCSVSSQAGKNPGRGDPRKAAQRVEWPRAHRTAAWPKASLQASSLPTLGLTLGMPLGAGTRGEGGRKERAASGMATLVLGLRLQPWWPGSPSASRPPRPLSACSASRTLQKLPTPAAQGVVSLLPHGGSHCTTRPGARGQQGPGERCPPTFTLQPLALAHTTGWAAGCLAPCLGPWSGWPSTPRASDLCHCLPPQSSPSWVQKPRGTIRRGKACMWPCGLYSGTTRDAAHRRMSATPTRPTMLSKEKRPPRTLAWERASLPIPDLPSLLWKLPIPKFSTQHAFPPALGDMTTEGFSLTTPRGKGRGPPGGGRARQSTASGEGRLG